ncbi:hypothetical protein CSKR_113107 [Clonorchis sinensis]|uniref:RNA polymerase II elongation factor ELL N-terminal domain-containing protein n=1 Tax=Clonorchis sinensis TaxID=79923 RepID=A0A8T1MZY5_CLOSI|nr:hypothetical protein CSKR_113107 [Clonorchis sinensis]
MVIPLSTDLQLIHLKSTESLGRALDYGLKSKNCRIQLTSTDDSVQLRLVTDTDEYCFQLEQEKNSDPTYFCVANVVGCSGTLIGPVAKRLRTAANDESFKHAREGLVKEVEELRQQKLKTRMYQEEFVSSLKSERSRTGKRALKQETKSKRSKPNADALSPTTVPQSTRTGQKHVESRILSPEDTVPAVTMDQSGSRIDERITNPILSHAPFKATSDCNLNSVGSGPSISLRERCLLAASRRRVLEARLASALANADKGERGTLIEEIRADLFALVDELLGDTELKRLKSQVITLD